MSRILMTVAASALVCASGVALAQQDANNPAPSYAATPPVKNQQVKHIQDGINAAPRYEAVAPVRNPGVATIQDGNNPAPVVKSASTNQTPQARRVKTTSKAAGALHARQHTRSASHG
jgi:hypothetical protein